MSEAHDDQIDYAAVARLRDWLAAKNGRAGEITMDTDLINEGVLDSLQMVNFLLYIEEIRGREIPEAMVQPAYFTSLRVIYDTFFHGF